MKHAYAKSRVEIYVVFVNEKYIFVFEFLYIQ